MNIIKRDFDARANARVGPCADPPLAIGTILPFDTKKMIERLSEAMVFYQAQLTSLK